MSDMYTSWTPNDLPAKFTDKFEITDTGLEASTSSRTLFKVVCKECGIRLHPCTTWPTAYVERHVCGQIDLTNI